MRYCDHEFIKISTEKIHSTEEYAVIVCHFCGRVKQVYRDGRVFVLKEEGEVTKTYGKTSDTSN